MLILFQRPTSGSFDFVPITIGNGTWYSPLPDFLGQFAFTHIFILKEAGFAETRVQIILHSATFPDFDLISKLKLATKKKGRHTAKFCLRSPGDQPSKPQICSFFCLRFFFREVPHNTFRRTLELCFEGKRITQLQVQKREQPRAGVSEQKSGRDSGEVVEATCLSPLSLSVCVSYSHPKFEQNCPCQTSFVECPLQCSSVRQVHCRHLVTVVLILCWQTVCRKPVQKYLWILMTLR